MTWTPIAKRQYIVADTISAGRLPRWHVVAGAPISPAGARHMVNIDGAFMATKRTTERVVDGLQVTEELLFKQKGGAA